MKKILTVILLFGIGFSGFSQSSSPNYDELFQLFAKEKLTENDSSLFLITAKADISYFMTLIRSYIAQNNNTDSAVAAGMQKIYLNNLLQLMDTSVGFYDRSDPGFNMRPSSSSGCTSMIAYIKDRDAIRSTATKSKVNDTAHFCTYEFRGKQSAIRVSADLKRVEKQFGKVKQKVWDVVITDIRVLAL